MRTRIFSSKDSTKEHRSGPRQESLEYERQVMKIKLNLEHEKTGEDYRCGGGGTLQSTSLVIVAAESSLETDSLCCGRDRRKGSFESTDQNGNDTCLSGTRECLLILEFLRSRDELVFPDRQHTKIIVTEKHVIDGEGECKRQYRL